jgi:molybdate transport system substrate-binding protein
MTRSARRACVPAVLAVLAGATADPVSAAEIRLLGAGSLRAALVQLAEQFQRETGHVLRIETLPGADVARILASNDEAADIYLGTAATVDKLVGERQAAGPKTLVGRVGIGVMVRRGAPVPNVATASDVKAAVLAADAVAYNTATSGQYLQKVFDDMGVSGGIKDKSVRPPSGAQTMERVMNGTGAEIGFGLRNEMTPYLDKGLQFVAMLPPELQSYTSYEAVVLARSTSREAASAFLQYLTAPAARLVFAGIGVD